MKIHKVQAPYMTKKNKLEMQAMETVTVTKFAIDYFKHKDDVFTPSEKAKGAESGQSGKNIVKEHVKRFTHHESGKNAYKKDILNKPDLCNEMILMCVNGYDKKQYPVGDWEIVRSVRKREENGFGADVYKKGDKITIAYGATDNKMDILTDVQMSRGEIPNQYKDAYKIFKEVREENPEMEILLTGTSLGGSLACLIASSDENTTAITFNAYGVEKIVENNPFLTDNGNSYNYITKGDPVSGSCTHIGNVIEKRQSALISHSISNFFGYFE